MSAAALFTPFSFKGLHLKNRIVMAPMTRSFAEDGAPGPKVAAYYRRRAEADVGLILSEGVAPERPAARNDPGVPVFHGEAALAGWGAVIEGVKAAGGAMMPQLWHVGALRNPSVKNFAPQPVDSPSGMASPGRPFTEPMSLEAIADSIAAFARAAAAAKALGFHGVELHGAHGYLIDQFFWAGTNQRTDVYGGETIADRARFAAEIIAAVRAAVGPDFPILIRLSQWKQQDFKARLAETPQAMEDWLSPLAEAGVDIFHCSQRRFWEAEFDGSDLNFAGWAKKITGKPTISVGSVGLSGDFIAAYRGEGAQAAPLDELVRRLEREEFDLVAVGRALLVDPEWAIKVRDGRAGELKPFSPEALGVLF